MLSDHHARDLRFYGLGAAAHQPDLAAVALAAELSAWATAHPEARLQQLMIAPHGGDGLAALLAYTDGAPAPEAQQAIAAAIEEIRTGQPEQPEQSPNRPPPFV